MGSTLPATEVAGRVESSSSAVTWGSIVAGAFAAATHTFYPDVAGFPSLADHGLYCRAKALARRPSRSPPRFVSRSCIVVRPRRLFHGTPSHQVSRYP